MSKSLRTTGDQQQESQRAQAQQASTEGAALRGELGIDSQLLAMSQAYMDLRAEGRWEEARAMRQRAIAFKAAADAYAAGQL